MKYLYYLLIILVFCACNTTKSIPEGQYLLDDYDIKSDNKKIDISNLDGFVRQKPNSSILGWKMRLGIYNAAGGNDTVTGLKRFIKNKLGQPPVIYNARQTEISAEQLQQELSNQGYLNAEVDTLLEGKNKKMKVEYSIRSGTPYTVRNYEYTLEDNVISRLLGRMKRYSDIKPGILFDKEILEEERTRLNTVLRNVGYYTFIKDNLYFRADTTLNTHQVDLYLSLRNVLDSLGYDRFRLRDVYITSGYDVTNPDNEDNFSNPDTSFHRGITIVKGKNKFLRNSTLLRNNYIAPGQFYADRISSRTYSAFNSLPAIKQTDVRFQPVVSSEGLDLLDAYVTLAPANAHWFQAGIDGTNSAGDFGIAPHVSYRHQNIFNGAEVLSIRLRGAYEFITGKKSSDILDQNYYEYGIETSLTFPQFLFPYLKRSWREIPSASTEITLGLNNQHRPEYTRQFFNAGYAFKWITKRNQLSHSLDLFDVNYVRMPSTSKVFDDYLNGTGEGNDDDNENARALLRETYRDQLIARSGYSVVYTKANRTPRFPRNAYTVRGSFDLAGWLPRLTRPLFGSSRNEDGQYEILGIAYAEYIKGTVGFTQTRNFNRKSSFAYNIALGVANPYGNSNVLPYEKRFFSGGANSIRGWQTRRLGPGSYKTNENTTFINQVGDIKLDLSIEYRHKLTGLFELAAFVDAGNIWTIKDYEGQEGGLFKFSDFYKEIAVAYGAGLRVDLNFLLLRLDLGTKLYDPGKDEGDRFVWFKGIAWHFGIGYPF